MVVQAKSPDLNFTGERVVPGKTPRHLILEHLVRYRFAAKHLGAADRVLDIGCGTGYGAAILAERAKRVVGVDSSWEAVQYAQRYCLHQNLYFAGADCRNLPFPDHAFDRAVLFEVIEHIAEQNTCLTEIRRVLTPDGTLILSTPNQARPTKDVEGPNPFHRKELQEHELLELLRPHFGHVQLLYQHELSGSSLEAAQSRNSGSVEVVENSLLAFPPKYFLAVCSRRPVRLPTSHVLAIGGIEHQIAIVRDLRQKEQEIVAQRGELEAWLKWREDKEADYSRNLAAHDDVIARLEEDNAALRNEIAAREGRIAALEERAAALEKETRARDARLADEVASHTAWREKAAALESELAGRNLRLGELEREAASRRMELEWLYRWLPINRLAHRLLYGRNLRRRIRQALGL